MLAKQHLIINQIPTSIFRNMIFFKYPTYQVPWNSMELQKSPMEFHGTFFGKWRGPWNSMECHRTRDYGKVPWNSMELGVLLFKFHGIPWNHRCCSNVVRKNSMELWRKFQGNFWSKQVSMSIEKRFWMIFWYVMSNAGNANGIMQILII